MGSASHTAAGIHTKALSADALNSETHCEPDSCSDSGGYNSAINRHTAAGITRSFTADTAYAIICDATANDAARFFSDHIADNGCAARAVTNSRPAFDDHTSHRTADQAASAR
jgi:hypothetical protein